MISRSKLQLPRTFLRIVAAAALVAAQAGLAGAFAATAKHLAPIPAETVALMAARNTGPSAPILMRLYKKESELEVWKQARDGRFVHLKTFPICRWSGQLGPKLRQGDRQAPEGFYAVTPGQMNPNSSYYLSFNIGYPNAYDRAHGATGSHLMVHGNCTSAGCYAMTDAAVGEIFSLAREAFAGGQRAFQFQAYPFRMTAQNLAKYRSDPNIAFWRQLKEGSDRFEATGLQPTVGVSSGRYAFAPFKDPAKEAVAVARRSEEEARIAALVTEGSASVRIAYADGGQHPYLATLARRGVYLGDVSRPETLAFAGRETVIVPARPKQTVLAAAAPILLQLPPVREREVAVDPAPRESLRGTMVATTFGLPGPPPLAEPPLFGPRALTSPATDASGARPGTQEAVPGSVRILSTALTAARFEVAAQF
jgi:murein L,D-transpeptidase YafK